MTSSGQREDAAAAANIESCPKSWGMVLDGAQCPESAWMMSCSEALARLDDQGTLNDLPGRGDD
jgi:hypothetical protein